MAMPRSASSAARCGPRPFRLVTGELEFRDIGDIPVTRDAEPFDCARSKQATSQCRTKAASAGLRAARLEVRERARQNWRLENLRPFVLCELQAILIPRIGD